MTATRRGGRATPGRATPPGGRCRPARPGWNGSTRTSCSPPADALAEAQRLLDGGFPFHAHEVLEGAWKSAPDDERPFWKGLAQLAVGLTHDQRGNRRGAVSLLRRGADTVADGTAAGVRHGVDANRLAAWGHGRADAIEGGGELGAGGPPQLRG